MDSDKVDIFGINMTDYTPEECYCMNPGCGRLIAPKRYASHLEKCMGLSKRTRPLRRLSNGNHTNSEQTINSEENDDVEEYNDDYDSYSEYPNNNKSLKTLRGRKKGTTKAKKEEDMKIYIESLKEKPLSELENILRQKCSVISSKTNKMCTKTLNCPQHTPEAKAQIREMLLGRSFDPTQFKRPGQT